MFGIDLTYPGVSLSLAINAAVCACYFLFGLSFLRTSHGGEDIVFQAVVMAGAVGHVVVTAALWGVAAGLFRAAGAPYKAGFLAALGLGLVAYVTIPIWTICIGLLHELRRSP